MKKPLMEAVCITYDSKNGLTSQRREIKPLQSNGDLWPVSQLFPEQSSRTHPDAFPLFA